MEPRLESEDYTRLLEFRTQLRRFLHGIEQRVAEVGLTPAQHQLLLAIRGHPDGRGPTVGNVANYLFLRHHSAVELIDRAVTAGLVVRRPDPANYRQVRLGLTTLGAQRLEQLTSVHLEELHRLGSALQSLTEGLRSP